ncbi:phage major capsid protein [Pelagibacterium lentulum]|uniref:Phage capsid protein n=1 Tax=Pelagibacterium lentulum TaxID=2029865 RepID=A0A916RFI5_9HYPH|nr:phage major capsid protein [Pelagibacterium lentulum]GGA54203.1 phage capsid protein [Pelagibacterium lentulum]
MTKSIEPRLENKAAALPAGDVTTMFAEFMSAFEEFKSTNDQRIETLEKRGSADVLIEDKLERLNSLLDGQKAALDRAAIEKARPTLEAGRVRGGDEYKDAFSAYVKRGEEKALSVGSSEDGGYLAPAETETEINRLLAAISPMRAICGVRRVSGSIYKRPVTVSGPQVGWVGETTARSQTNSQVLDELSFPTTELYAMPAATQNFLDDAAVDVGQWIAEEVNAAFAEQETAAFILGDGVNKPTGFLDADIVPEGDWEWNKLGYVPTGVDGSFSGTVDPVDASDVLIDLVYTLKAGYRQNATWLMNRRTQGAIRKLKDADGNYLWQPAARADGRATLMGFPLVEAEDMPDIDVDATPIAFGDFRRGYLIVDRQGVNVLRDPYSAKPYVLFYTTKRVGGGIADYDAIKLLKFSES